MTDTQAINDVSFDFKSTRVCHFVSGSTDYQMNNSRCKSFLNDQSLFCLFDLIL